MIYDYVAKYGMSEEVGMVNLEVCNASRGTQLRTVSGMAKELEDRTYKVMKEHYAQLERLAEKLIDEETIYSDDVTGIVKGTQRKHTEELQKGDV